MAYKYLDYNTDSKKGIVFVNFIPYKNRFNILTVDFLMEILDFLEKIKDDSFKVIRFFGTEGSFAVGADISVMKNYGASHAKAFSILGNRVFNNISNMPQVFIAEIDGYCFGGGFDFAAACDFRFSTINSTFAHQGINMGFITGFGGTVRSGKTMKYAAVREVFFTGRIFDAKYMKKAFFLQEIYEKSRLMHTKVEDFVNKIVNKDLSTIERIKNTINAAFSRCLCV